MPECASPAAVRRVRIEDSGEPLRTLPPSSAALPTLELRPFGGVPGGVPAPLPAFPCSLFASSLHQDHSFNCGNASSVDK